MSRNRTKARWSYQAGKRPYTVTVYERRPGGLLYVSVWDPGARSGRGGEVRKSLRHRDKARAETYALEQAASLRSGHEALARGQPQLGTIFALYESHRTPRKAPATQGADRQRIELFRRVWGADANPMSIGAQEWDSFMEARATGAIDARGNAVSQSKRRPVRSRALEADGRWLHAVFTWATKFKVNGRYLLAGNPVRGFMGEDHLPREKNPVNDAITEERHLAMLMRAQCIEMELRWKGEKRRRVESWLPELLAVANGTGRRLGAICALRLEDLNLEPGPRTPHGSIDWRADEDKEGYSWLKIPIDTATRDALDQAIKKRHRLGRVGAGPLFVSPSDPDRPISPDLAVRWYRRAEALERADLPSLDPMPATRVFHGYRAKWATETKHLPERDRAEVGGWKSAETIRRVYDKADRDTMLRVVTERGKLRELGS